MKTVHQNKLLRTKVLLVKTLLIMTFLTVVYQDIKERQVYWFLFPAIAIFAAILLYNNTVRPVFLWTILINLGVILILLLTIFLYSKFKLQKSLSETFGLGDALLFLALAFTFSNISFLVLFVFGLIFSLLLHLNLKFRTLNHTVPLAGYLSLFFALAYIGHWLNLVPNPYTL